MDTGATTNQPTAVTAAPRTFIPELHLCIQDDKVKTIVAPKRVTRSEDQEQRLKVRPAAEDEEIKDATEPTPLDDEELEPECPGMSTIITLVSKDGDQFSISLAAAMRSDMIAGILSSGMYTFTLVKGDPLAVLVLRLTRRKC